MKLTTIAVATSLALFSLSSHAASPDWDLIEVSYVKADVDGSDGFKPDGLAISGSKLLNKDFFVAGSYSSLSDDIAGVDIDFDQASAGLGYRFGLSSQTDLYGIVSYEYVEVSGDFQGFSNSEDENGYGLTVGVRSRLTEQFEVNAAMGYVDIDDDDETSFSVSGYYYFNNNVALGLGYGVSDDVDTFSASLRYAF